MQFPQWFTETFEGMDEQMMGDLLIAMTAKIKPGQDLDEIGLKILESKVVIKAAKQMKGIEEGANRAWQRLMFRIQTNRLYQYEGEFSTFEEFCIDSYIHLQEHRSRYDFLFLMEKFLPLLNDLGKEWAPELLMRSQDKSEKLRAAVPTMRNVWEKFQTVDSEYKAVIEEKEKDLRQLQRKLEVLDPQSDNFKQTMVVVTEIADALPKIRQEQEAAIIEAGEVFKNETLHILDVVNRPGIKPEGPGGVRETLKNNTPIHIEGLKAQTRDEVVFFIAVPRRQAGLIEAALHNIVSVTDTDPIVIYHEVQRFFPNEGGK